MHSLAHIDHAVQGLHLWLDELARELGWSGREQAYRALHIVLPLVRRHLPAGEAADLAAQLPLLARALFFEGWRPAKEPVRDRDGDTFIAEIAKGFSAVPGASPSEIAGAVFALLSRHVSRGEIVQVRKSLPEGVRRHWQEAA